MTLKGLLEWKIFAAIFAVLIVASSAIFGSGGISSGLLNATGGGLDFGKLPFGSLFSPHAEEEAAPGVNDVTIVLMVERMDMGFDSPVNITSGDSEITGFTGQVEFDFLANTTSFAPAGSSMLMRKGIEVTQISGVTIKNMTLSGVDYSVTSGGATTAGKDDMLEIRDFSGTLSASGSLTLSGTAGFVTNGKWTIGR